VPRCRAAWLPFLPWLARIVAVWAVLAGLFLMHGVASPAGGCSGSPVTAMSLMAGMPAMTPASAALDAGDMATPPASAGTAVALARHAGVPAAAAAVADASPARTSCGGMPCAARQPRNAPAGARGAPPASAAVLTALPAPTVPASAFRRACRPPGRPGLPLPLFLSVSRT
jgi:hypothetical protein